MVTGRRPENSPIVAAFSYVASRREMAILRAMGVRPEHAISLMLGQDWITREFGLVVELNLFTPGLVYVLIAIALFACLVGLIPGISMNCYALIDGMNVRI